MPISTDAQDVLFYLPDCRRDATSKTLEGRVAHWARIWTARGRAVLRVAMMSSSLRGFLSIYLLPWKTIFLLLFWVHIVVYVQFVSFMKRNMWTFVQVSRETCHKWTFQEFYQLWTYTHFAWAFKPWKWYGCFKIVQIPTWNPSWISVWSEGVKIDCMRYRLVFW